MEDNKTVNAELCSPKALKTTLPVEMPLSRRVSLPQFPSASGDSRRFEDAINTLKRHGLLNSPQILEALSLLSVSPGHQAANIFLCSVLSKIRTEETIRGRNPFASVPLGGLSGSISMGCYVNANSMNPVGLLLEEIAQNVIVTGMQGSGKSNFLKSLVSANIASPLIRFSIFTKKKDERAFIKYGQPILIVRETDPFNHLDSLGYPFNRHAMATAANFTFSTRLWLGPESVLAQTIQRLGEKIGAPPKWSEVRGYIQQIRFNDRAMREFLASLDLKMGYLIQTFDEAFKSRRGFNLRHSMYSNVVYELPLDCPADIRRFHVLQIISWCFHFRRYWFSTLTEEEIGRVPLLCFVLDDGHEIFSSEQETAGHNSLPPFYEVITTARAYKLAFIVATHTPEGLSKVMWGCHGTTLALRLPSKLSRNRVCEVL